ncbi:protein of unknown function [Saccharicrinis carchari]|uniref:DUF4249 domain-containing protein n=1 Tax=Saccharicrinis carchari TaxID=1168039 RepID=A0A521B7U8_SACCC|nr:DUF4249 domain-containing protein [Saccharicrinis carchari]SMO43135.1 protein of unknown function [Saccharicrinis carchari]
MKKTKYIHLTILLLSITLVSCEKKLEYQLINQKPQVVMYAFPMPDSTLKIHGSYSTDILSTIDFKGIEGLEYSISVNEEEKHTGTYPTGEIWHYTAELEGKSGNNYRLEFQLPNGNKTWGSTTVPHPISILNLDTITTTYTNTDGSIEKMLRCSVEINDPEEAENYYQIRVDYIEYDLSGQLAPNIATVTYIKEDKVFLVRKDDSSVLLADVDLQGTFTDYLFNGKNYKIKLLIPEKYLNNSSDTLATKLIVHLYTLTPEYYSFLRSSIEESAIKDYPVFDPVNQYSNINNGVGVVAGLAVAKDTLLLQ